MAGDDHEHFYAEEREPSGRLILTPCLVCGLTAMDALHQLRVERDELREEILVTQGRTDGLEVEIAELEAALTAARHWHEQLNYDEALSVIDGVLDRRVYCTKASWQPEGHAICRLPVGHDGAHRWEVQ